MKRKLNVLREKLKQKLNIRKIAILIIASAAVSLLPCTEVLPESENGRLFSGEILSEDRVEVAANDFFTLWFDGKTQTVEIHDKDGGIWLSSPAAQKDNGNVPAVRDDASASVLHVEYADRLANLSVLYSANRFMKKTFSAYRLEDGIRLEYGFPAYGFMIPVTIRLAEGFVTTSILAAGIKEENADFGITRIACTPYFGAAGPEEKGYIFVPDGSGALIRINNASGLKKDYSQYVYGRDASVNPLQESPLTQKAGMPVYGLKTDGRAMFGIITAGAPRALIHASVNGVRNVYNYVYPEFIFRDYDMVFVEKKFQTVRLLEKNRADSQDFTFRTYFLYGNDADYSGMARLYRKYLETDEGLTASDEEDDLLFLDVYGAVRAQQNVLGFPVERTIPLTTYDEAGEMVSDLLGSLTDGPEVLLNYLEWEKGGTRSAMPDSLLPEKRLGGRKDLDNLVRLMSDINSMLFLDFNLTDMQKPTLKYNRLYASASAVQRSPTIQYRYWPHDQTIRYSDPVFLIDPRRIAGIADSLAGSIKGSGVQGVGIRTLGNKLYSDFSRDPLTRDEAEKLVRSTIDVLQGTGKPIMTSDANAYAFYGSSYISDAPISSSGFYAESYEIPFYQMVLKGIRPMSVPSLNMGSDIRTAILKAVETGMSLKFTLTCRNEDVLGETMLRNLISTNYSNWAETIRDVYIETAPAIQAVRGARIISHERAAEGLTVTVYENGTVIYVNFGTEAVEYEGIMIDAMDYEVRKKQGGTFDVAWTQK
ncbi:MAG: DUF5696 domain-containing protein [Saccharofermentanales bacterium]